MPQPQQQVQQQEQAQQKPSRATMNRWEYLDMVRKNFPFAKALENKELWKMLTDKNPDAKNWKFKDSPKDIQNKEEQKATSIFLNELNLKNPNKTARDEHGDNINKLINQSVADSVFKEIAKIDKPDTVYTQPAPKKPAYDPSVHGFGYKGTLPLTLEEFPHAPYMTPEGETVESNVLTASDTDKPLDQNPTKWRLYPTFRGGKPMTDQQIEEMLASGEHFGVYDSKEEVEAADGYIHDEFARQKMMKFDDAAKRAQSKEITPLEMEMVERWRVFQARVDDKGRPDPEGKGYGPDYGEINKTYLRELSRVEKFFGTTIHNSVTGEAMKWLLNPIIDDDELFERYMLKDMNTAEEIGSIVLSFLLPLDKLAFLKGGKLITSIVKKGKDNAVNLIVRKGIPLKLAQKSVNAGWLRIAERITMSAGGIGAHSTAHQIGIAMNDEQQHNMSEFVQNYLAMGSLGGLAAGAGGVTGRVVSRIPKLQRALRGHSGSVLDFMAEAAVFAGLGPVLSGQEIPKEWEEKLEFYGDEVTHTTGVLLGIRFLLGGVKGYPHKTKAGDGLKIEKALRERVDAGEDIVEATKRVAEQLEIPLDMSSKKLSKLRENIEKDTKQLDLFERETNKLIERAKKTKKAKQASDKTARESQYKLDISHAKNEIKLAISEGRYNDAGRLAQDITKQGENPDIIVQEARKELLKESGPKITRKRKRFINAASHAATRLAQGRPDATAHTNARLYKNMDKGQDRLWEVKMPTKAPITDRAKLKKVKDMRTKKGDKVIVPTKEYKTIEDAQLAADKIRSEHIPENVIFNFIRAPQKAGSVIDRILMKAIIRKADVGKAKYPVRTEKSLGQETTGKKPPKSFSEEESPVKVVRNPMDASTSEKRLELLEKEKGELTYGLNNEVMKMESKRRELASQGEIQIEVNPQIVALKRSIEARRELLRQNERNRTSTMSVKELSTIALLNMPKKARGAVGKDVKKGKTKEEKQIDSHFKHIMREFLRRAESAGVNAEKAFVDYLGRKGVSDPLVKEYLEQNFQTLRKEVGIENALEMLDAVQHGDFSVYEPRPADPNIRPAKPESPEKYSGPKNISMHSQELQDVIRAVNERIGRQYDEDNIRRRYKGEPVTIQEMRNQSKHVINQREVYDMIVSGRGGSLNFEKHILLVTDNLKTAQEAWNAHPDSQSHMQLFALHLETLHKLATVWGKAGKALQEPGRPDRKALMNILQLNQGGAIQMADLLKMVEATYGVKNARPSRSALWVIAEFTRNMKLASISSYMKSVIGNTAMTMMEISSRAFRPALASAFSLFSGKPSGISRHEVFTLGRANAFSKGLLDTKDGGFRVAWELLKENEAYVKENPYLTNEGFGKDIPTFVGKLIRTPQNLHGALDAIYRIPWTHRWAYELAQRAAVRELRGKGMPLSVRNVAELTDKYISEHKDYFFNDAKAKAREQVYQKELGEIGRGINALRTKAHWSGAFFNILAPFVVTHTNVFKKMVEFSPLGVFNKPILDMLIDIGQRPFYLMKGKKGTELTKGDPDLAAEYGSRVIVGTAIMGLTHSVISSMLESDFEGSWGDKTKEEKELLINMGKTPYSIKIGGRNWDIRGIDPVSMYINSMVSYAQAPEEKGLKGKVLKAAGELAEYISNHPIAMLTSDWSQFTKDEKSAGRIIGRLTSSMWQPTLSRQLKRLEDPQRYRDVMAGDVSTDGDYYTYKEAGTEAVRVHNMKFFDSYIENRWPQQDIFGMPVIQRSDSGMLLGIRSYEVEDNPDRKKVYEEYLRLFDNNLGVSKFGRVGSEITKGNIKIKLSHEEQHVINHYIGKAYFDLINEDMESPQYKKLTSPDGKSDDNRKREFWIKRRNSKYKKIYVGLDKDQNPKYNEVGVVEYVKHYLLKDMVKLAKSLDRMDREQDFGRDANFYELRGSRYVKELKRIAPNISDEEIDEVINLTRAGPNRAEDAGESNFEKAISIMRKNMPWEQRDFVDEAYKVRERTGVGKSAYER